MTRHQYPSCFSEDDRMEISEALGTIDMGVDHLREALLGAGFHADTRLKTNGDVMNAHPIPFGLHAKLEEVLREINDVFDPDVNEESEESA